VIDSGILPYLPTNVGGTLESDDAQMDWPLLVVLLHGCGRRPLGIMFLLKVFGVGGSANGNEKLSSAGMGGQMIRICQRKFEKGCKRRRIPHIYPIISGCNPDGFGPSRAIEMARRTFHTLPFHPKRS